MDVVTWAPTSRRRRRARGYDQAELLARAVARRSRLRSRPLLRRLSEQPQTGRGRRDRLAGPRFVAAAVPGATVLVVDDVWTTGATLSAAGTALRNAGAARVLGATLARAGSAVEPSGGLP